MEDFFFFFSLSLVYSIIDDNINDAFFKDNYNEVCVVCVGERD